MNGNVFQLQSEGRKKGQFKDTLDALKVLASTEFKKDISYLELLFQELKEPTVNPPKRPKPVVIKDEQTGLDVEVKPSDEDMDLYRERVKVHVQIELRLENTKRALFNIVWGQSSRLLQNKLKATKSFDKILSEGDIVTLLKEIKKIAHQAEDNVCIYDALDEVMRRFYTYRQSPDEDNATHLEKFKDFVEVLEYFGVDMFCDPCLVNYEKEQDKKKNLPPVSDESYKERAKQRQLGTAFIRRSNMKQYGPLLRSMRDQFLHGFDVYPQGIEEAYALLQNHSSKRKQVQGANAPAPSPATNRNNEGRRGNCQHNEADTSQNIRSGMQHAQRSYSRAHNSDLPAQNIPVPGRDGRVNPNIVCYNCTNRGHYADNCPSERHRPDSSTAVDTPDNKKVTFQQHMMHAAVLDEAVDAEDDDDSVVIGFQHATIKDMPNRQVDHTNILLDTGSNCSVFNNQEYVRNIRHSELLLSAQNNGGELVSTHVGDLPGFFEVWYNPDSIMNILSFDQVKDRYRVTLDSAETSAIPVHLGQDKKLLFTPKGNGLYLLSNISVLTTNKNIMCYTNLSLVSENKSMFTRRQIQGAEHARTLYKSINKPGYAKFLRLLQNNYFRDSPVTTDNVKRAVFIYGRDVSNLQGRATRPRPQPLRDMTSSMIHLPPTIQAFHSAIQLSIDVMFVQTIPFVTTISNESYQFRTVEPIFKPNKDDLTKCIDNVIKMYKNRNIQIVQINGDNEFEHIRQVPEVSGIHLNILAANEHVGPIERSIRTIKDGTRMIVHSLPFKRYPRAMIAGAVVKTVQSLNELPAENGVSDTLSPKTLIVGTPAPSYKQITALNFGDYVHVPNESNSKNTPRTTGAIALFPSRNSSDSWYFMSLVTGSTIHRYKWDQLPASQDTIKQVHHIADTQKQSPVDKNFGYELILGTPLRELDEDNISPTITEELSDSEINNADTLPISNQMLKSAGARMINENDLEGEPMNQEDEN